MHKNIFSPSSRVTSSTDAVVLGANCFPAAATANGVGTNGARENNGRCGFIIVEAIIALSVLTVCFFGIIDLLTSSIRASRVSAETYTANYLAMEGIELVKNLVDADISYSQNAMNDACAWSTSPILQGGGTFETDYTIISPTWKPSSPCNGVSATSSCPTQCPSAVALKPLATPRALFLDPSANRYRYDVTGGLQTPFTRRITITPMSVNGIKGEIRKDEIKVISAVAWTTIGGEQRSVSLEDHFFNWVRR